MSRDYKYEECNKIIYPNCYNFNIKCKNYILCQNILPEWWFSCKKNYLCTSCDTLFGTLGSQKGKGVLDSMKNMECPICLEFSEICLSFPRCDHFVCVKCLKRCFYGEKRICEPIFPYKDIEQEYFADPDNVKWKIYYPLIEKYIKYYNDWDNYYNEKYSNEENLRKCPICRL